MNPAPSKYLMILRIRGAGVYLEAKFIMNNKKVRGE
jgi:hypothetical protein